MTYVGNLTSGRLLARNTVLNLVGQGVPFIVGIIAIPVLIHAVGVDRYGVFSLSMMIVGYLGLFDLGLGTAVTKLIAEAVGAGDGANIPDFFWTSLLLLSGAGIALAILISLISPWLVRHLFDIPQALQAESLHGLYVTAFSLPFVVSNASLNGTLAALQRFDLINYMRVPAGIFFYVGPLAALPFSHSITLLVATLIAGRFIVWLASFVLCLRVMPSLKSNVRLHRHTAGAMLRYGGWVNVSAVVTSFADYADRLVIGASLPVAAVSYYAVPRQMASKLLIVPNAMVNVIFAAFSATLKRDPQRAALLLERATRYIFLALLPLVLFAITLAPEILTLWLGPQFSGHSTNIFRWIAAGMFVHSLAWPASAVLPAAHRPDIPTKVHIIEVPAYLGFLWLMVSRFGPGGAAIAWTITVSVDAIAMFVIVRKLFPLATPTVARIGALASIALPLLGIGWVLPNLTAKSLFLVGFMIGYTLLTWLLLLDPEEKDFICRYLRVRRWLSARHEGDIGK